LDRRSRPLSSRSQRGESQGDGEGGRPGHRPCGDREEESRGRSLPASALRQEEGRHEERQGGDTEADRPWSWGEEPSEDGKPQGWYESGAGSREGKTRDRGEEAGPWLPGEGSEEGDGGEDSRDFLGAPASSPAGRGKKSRRGRRRSQG